MKYLCLLLLSACSISMHEQAARVGYTHAVACLYPKSVAIPFDSIKRVIKPGRSFSHTYNGTTWYGLAGFADDRKAQILVAHAYKDNPIIWSHEWIHILGPVQDHPDSLFTRCRVR
jgi:hypothetical protein